MSTRLVSGAVTLVVLAVAAQPLRAQAAMSHTPHAMNVSMTQVSATRFAFEPAQIVAHPGDTVRFVQSGVMPHNVQFKRVAPGASLGAAMMGPFLTTPGQVYTLVIDNRFTLGSYDFTCTPHESMGMNGTLTVAPPVPR